MKVSKIIRHMFGKGDDKRDKGLVPPESVARYENIVYGEDSFWQSLNVYRPKDKEGEKLPVLIDVHGGGWSYGDKERYSWFCMDVARRGIAVVNFTYRLCPEYQYPAMMEDINLAVKWTLDHAQAYDFDLDHVYMAGDSAGAHMTCIYCDILTNSEYAAGYDFKAPEGFLPQAVLLNSGIYKMETKGKNNLFTLSIMKELLPNQGNKEELDLVSPIFHMNEKFPPAYITTAYGDFVFDQAPMLDEKLTELGVPHTFKIYGTKEQALGHVFLLNMRLPEGQQCIDDEVEFLLQY